MKRRTTHIAIGLNFSLVVATWLCVTVASVSVVAQGELPAGPALPKPQLPIDSVPEASRDVRAIEGIRERIGGSVLKGTFLEGKAALDDAEFRRKAAEWEREFMEGSHLGVHDVPGISGPHNLAPSSHAHLPAPVQYSEPLDPLQAATQQLRVSARNLDLLAADLEDAGKFKEADRLRASAQKLRREARDFSRQATAEPNITR